MKEALTNISSNGLQSPFLLLIKTTNPTFLIWFFFLEFFFSVQVHILYVFKKRKKKKSPNLYFQKKIKKKVHTLYFIELLFGRKT